ncbi:MAG: hypothetical protein P8179_20220 [Candidatus Thiodiazotropha sp.]
MKGAFVVVQGKGRSCTSMYGAQRRTIARYSKELQRRHVPPQACHSRCSVTHPVGNQVHRTIFRKINILISEWSGQLIF